MALPDDEVLAQSLHSHASIAAAARDLDVPDRVMRAFARLKGIVPGQAETPSRGSDPDMSDTARTERKQEQAVKFIPPEETPPSYSPPKTVRDVAEERRRLEAYIEYDTDAESSKALKLSREAFYAWRNNRSLPRKNPGGPSSARPDGVPESYTPPKRLQDTHEEQRRLSAYLEQETEEEAASNLGISKEAFHLWRLNRRLPPKPNPSPAHNQVKEAHPPVEDALKDKEPRGRSPSDWSTFQPDGPWNEELLHQAYQATETDAAAAKLLGLNGAAFGGWRAYRGLPNRHSNRSVPNPPQDQDIEKALATSDGITGAARKLGCNYALVKAYMMVHGVQKERAPRTDLKKPEKRAPGTASQGPAKHSSTKSPPRSTGPDTTVSWVPPEERADLVKDGWFYEYTSTDSITFWRYKDHELVSSIRVSPQEASRRLDGINTQIGGISEYGHIVQTASRIEHLDQQLFRNTDPVRNGPLTASRRGGPSAAAGREPPSDSTTGQDSTREDDHGKARPQKQPLGNSKRPEPTTEITKHGWYWRAMGTAIVAKKFDTDLPVANINLSPSEVEEWFGSNPVDDAGAMFWVKVDDEGAAGTLDELASLDEDQSGNDEESTGPPAAQSQREPIDDPAPEQRIERPAPAEHASRPKPAWKKPENYTSTESQTPAWRSPDPAWRSNAQEARPKIKLEDMLGEKKRLVRKHLPKFKGECELCRKDGFRDGLHYLNHVCSFHKRAGVSAYIGEGLRAMVAMADGDLANGMTVNDVIVRVKRLPPIITCPECREDIGQRPHTWASHFKDIHKDEIGDVVGRFVNKLIPGLLSN